MWTVAARAKLGTTADEFLFVCAEPALSPHVQSTFAAPLDAPVRPINVLRVIYYEYIFYHVQSMSVRVIHRLIHFPPMFNQMLARSVGKKIYTCLAFFLVDEATVESCPCK